MKGKSLTPCVLSSLVECSSPAALAVTQPGSSSTAHQWGALGTHTSHPCQSPGHFCSELTGVGQGFSSLRAVRFERGWHRTRGFVPLQVDVVAATCLVPAVTVGIGHTCGIGHTWGCGGRMRQVDVPGALHSPGWARGDTSWACKRHLFD